MAVITIEIDGAERDTLGQLAAQAGLSEDALVEQWTRQRLVHEREKLTGGGNPMSPRARREAGSAE